MPEKPIKTLFSPKRNLEYIFPIFLLIKIILTPMILLIDLLKIPITLINLNCLILISFSTICFFLNQNIAGFVTLLLSYLFSILIEYFDNRETTQSYIETKQENRITVLFSLLSTPLLAIGILNSESPLFPWLVVIAFIGSVIYQRNERILHSEVKLKTDLLNWIQKIILSQLIPNKEIRNENKIGWFLYILHMNICSKKGVLFLSILILFMFSQNTTLVLLTIMIIGQLMVGMLLIIGTLFFDKSSLNEDIR